MNKKNWVGWIGLFICFLACSNSNEGKAETEGLQSFSLQVGNRIYQAVIDQSTCSVSVGGIDQASAITGVQYTLAGGATISPDPKTITTWKKEQVFVVALSDGSRLSYTVYLKDLKEEEVPVPPQEKVVIGYVPGSDWEYETEFRNIHWEYLTHINVSFLYVTATGELLDDEVRGHLEEIRQTAKEHGVKVLISLQSDGQRGFATVIRDAALRQKVAEKAVQYVRDHQLDGVDVDFEIYDAVGPDLLAFVKKLHEVKDENMLQTCAVATWNAGQGYSTEWHKYFDYINLMAYDFTGGWAQEGQHSSFEQSVGLIDLWLNTLQAPASKLVLGLPFYGYSWDENIQVDASKAIRYHQILTAYPGQNVSEKDQVGRTYYNGKPTIRKKCRYVGEHGLAGVMIWQIFQDAKEEQYSLLKVVGEEMNNN